MERNILKGKRIALTALDLEQEEHRGLAVLSKTLIELLKKYGAEVYLITSINSFRLNPITKRTITRKLRNEIFVADICEKLDKGTSYRKKFKKNKLYKFKIIVNLIIKVISLNLYNFNLKKIFLTLTELHKDINIHSPRMSYLKSLEGFIYVNEIFNVTRLRSMRLLHKCPKLKIPKKDLDLIMTSCPISLVNNDPRSANIVQIIPDAIPIQVANHPENPVTFYNRLIDAHLSKTLYISETTRSIVKDILRIQNKQDDQNEILYPMPSITSDALLEAKTIPTIREINNPYILFNSSIVERKRVELTINYFNSSKLPDSNFMLLIAGKIHDSEYCERIKKMCEKNESIVLLDYVSEIEKVWLFLNATLLISTSSSEGFGIPVLDAACLKLPVLASNISSHLEIKKLTNSSNIKLLDIKNEQSWVSYLNNLITFDKENENSKLKRIKFFKESLEKLEYKSLAKIQKLINH